MAEPTIDKELDLSNEVCPYTFMKTKLALQGMESGQHLQVRLGNSESASNVPRSIELEGHEVVSLEQPGDSEWLVVVKRSAS
jgi:TusA-related sulfurtransferase